MPNQDTKDFANLDTKMTEKNRIKTTIANVYNSLVNVTVVTAVGNVGVTLKTTEGDEKIDVEVASSGTLRSFVTQIDLLEGDIVATLPDDFDQLQSVEALHERNVRMAATVLPNNITALINAGREVIRLFDN